MRIKQYFELMDAKTVVLSSGMASLKHPSVTNQSCYKFVALVLEQAKKNQAFC